MNIFEAKCQAFKPDGRPGSPDDEPHRIKFGDLNFLEGKPPKHFGDKLYEVFGKFTSAEDLKAAIAGEKLSLEDLWYLVGVMTRTSGGSRYDTFQRVQTIAASLGHAEEVGEGFTREDTLSTGESARWGRSDGSHPEKRYRGDGDRD